MEVDEEPTVKESRRAETVTPEVWGDVAELIENGEKAAQTGEIRYILRVLRLVQTLRRAMTTEKLRQLASLIGDLSVKQHFVDCFGPQMEVEEEEKEEKEKPNSEMEVDESEETQPETAKQEDGTQKTEREEERRKKPKKLTKSSTPEVCLSLLLLCGLQQLDRRELDSATRVLTSLQSTLDTFSPNRYTLDVVAARCLFFLIRAYELQGSKDAEVRSLLHRRLRTATLQHSPHVLATSYTQLLRLLTAHSQFEQIRRLFERSPLPETAPSAQLARYYYYCALLHTVQLDYATAHRLLRLALRKAPGTKARGFRLAVNKLLCTVQLLMGDIPEKSFFRQQDLTRQLLPYFKLAKAVRVGDLDAFKVVLEKYGEVFKRDKTFTLIQRLRTNVIKTGLRKINLAYSRISLSDICEKLRLENVEDAEGIVAKSIRDGVIDAVINNQEGFVQSRGLTDVYSTEEPQTAFQERIKFCLNIHNEAVKAMRYPEKHSAEDFSRNEDQGKIEEIAEDEDEEDNQDII